MDNATTAATASAKMCSKCGKNPTAYPETTNPWCLDCLAEQKREYVAKLKKQNAEQAFARGVAAARTMIIRNFLRMAAGSFTGHQVAELIRGSKSPQFDAPSEN